MGLHWEKLSNKNTRLSKSLWPFDNLFIRTIGKGFTQINVQVTQINQLVMQIDGLGTQIKSTLSQINVTKPKMSQPVKRYQKK